MRSTIRRSMSPAKRKQKTAAELIDEVKAKESRFVNKIIVMNPFTCATDYEIERAPSMISRNPSMKSSRRNSVVRDGIVVAPAVHPPMERQPSSKARRGRSLSRLFRRPSASLTLEDYYNEDAAPNALVAGRSRSVGKKQVPPPLAVNQVDLGESDIKDVQSALREMEKELKVAKRRGTAISRAKVMDALMSVVDSLEHEKAAQEQQASAPKVAAPTTPPRLLDTITTIAGGQSGHAGTSTTIAGGQSGHTGTYTTTTGTNSRDTGISYFDSTIPPQRNDSLGSDSASTNTNCTGNYTFDDERTYEGSLSASTDSTTEKDDTAMRAPSFKQIGELFTSWNEARSEYSDEEDEDHHDDESTVTEVTAKPKGQRLFRSWSARSEKSEAEETQDEQVVAATRTNCQIFPSCGAKTVPRKAKKVELPPDVKKPEVKPAQTSNIMGSSIFGSCGAKPSAPEAPAEVMVTVTEKNATQASLVEMPDFASWLDLGDDNVKKMWDDLLWVSPAATVSTDKPTSTDEPASGQKSVAINKACTRDSMDEIVVMRQRSDNWGPEVWQPEVSSTDASTTSRENSEEVDTSPERPKQAGRARSWFRRVKINSKLSKHNRSNKLQPSHQDHLPTKIVICEYKPEDSRIEYEEDEIKPPATAAAFNLESVMPQRSRQYRLADEKHPSLVV